MTNKHVTKASQYPNFSQGYRPDETLTADDVAALKAAGFRLVGAQWYSKGYGPVTETPGDGSLNQYRPNLVSRHS